MKQRRRKRRKMRSLICNCCNKEFFDENEQKIHYKSEWHTYNLKLLNLPFFVLLESKNEFYCINITPCVPLDFEIQTDLSLTVAGVPGLNEALFIARQSALAEETPLLYSCVHCGKEYRSFKAHAQHLKSKTHLARASQETGHHHDENSIISGRNESEWEEVDQEEEIACEDNDSLRQLKMNGSSTSNGVMDDEGSNVDELDPRSCFMCGLKHDTVENCAVHMHKKHGFFIPDIEYLKDPEGFLTYLGLKVRRDYMCLYCNDRCRPFSSLEAVRKHMDVKNHCKVHYGDGGDDEEAKIEEFYDYSSSYGDATGKQLVSSEDFNNNVELGSGGSELIITTRTDDRLSVKSIGSREFLRYYRQKPRPTRTNDTAISSALASRYRSMSLATV